MLKPGPRVLLSSFIAVYLSNRFLKSMKKTIFLAMAMIVAITAFSQERQRGGQARRRQINPEAMALAQTKNLQEVLQLDSVQYQAIFLMNYSDAMAMQDSMKARRERAERDGKRVQPTDEERKARAEVMKKRMEVRNEQMKQILTEEQYNKYLEYQKKSMHNGRRPRGGRFPGGGE